jgi:hypothetical protein
VVVQVNLDPNSDTAHGHSILNDIVIPEAQALPGIQEGTWMNDGAATVTCVIVFVTADNANAAVAPMTPDAGPPLISCGVFEVEIEA